MEEKILMKFGKQLKEKHKNAVNRIDQYQEAISFAQAGAREEALEVLQASQEMPEQKTSRLLVLAQGDHFPEEVREYALDMAKRLGYEILALNTAPIKREAWRFFNLDSKSLRQEFKSASQKNFSIFQSEADKRRVPITHLVKFVDKEDALQELKQEIQDLDFIVSDSEPLQPRPRNEDTPNRLQKELCVYTLM